MAAFLTCGVALRAGRIARGPQGEKPGPASPRAYLGFDRNRYPGDASLGLLRKTFSFSGYWLNVPPGETVNTWQGKRAVLASNGFGFLVLFNGRLDRALKSVANARALGSPRFARCHPVSAERGISAGNDRFSRPRRGRANAARASRVCLRLDRRSQCFRLPRRSLLFRDARTRRSRSNHRDGERPARPGWRTEDFFFRLQRRVSSIDGLRFSREFAATGEERRSLCFHLAIRAIASTAGSDGRLPIAVQLRWQLLRSFISTKTGDVHRS